MNTGGRDTVGHCSCALESSNSGDAGMGRKRTGRQDHSDNCFGAVIRAAMQHISTRRTP